MIKKKMLAVLCATLIASVSLAMPVSARQVPLKPVVYLNGVIQPYWDIAYDADLFLYLSGGKVYAEIEYSKPTSASASMSIKIYERASINSSWKQVASSSSAYASCPAKTGYEYKAEAKLTLTMNGIPEVIDLSVEL